MANVAGKDATFGLGTTGVPGTPTDISAYVDSVSFPQSADTYETSALGDDAKTYIPGQTDATITVGGPWDATVDAHMDGVVGNAVVLAYSYSPDAGTTTYTGNCILTSYDNSSPVGDNVTWTASLQCTGTVTRT